MGTQPVVRIFPCFRSAAVALAAVIVAALGLTSSNVAAAEVASPRSVPAAGGFPLLVTNSGAGTVTDIGPSWRVTLKTGGEPIDVAFTPDGTYAYVTNQGDSWVNVIDAANTAHPTVSKTTLPVGTPGSIAVTPDGKYAYVTEGQSNTVAVISGADTAHPIVSKTLTVGDSPTGIAVTPDGQYVYVTIWSGIYSTVRVIDGADSADPTVSKTVLKVGSIPNSVAVTPDGQYAYVTDSGTNTVSVIDGADTTDPTVSKKVLTVGQQPMGVAITPDGQYAYVASLQDNTVSVIDGADTADPRVSGTPLNVGYLPWAVAVTPDGQYAYVSNDDAGTVSVIDGADTADPTVSGTPLKVGNAPAGLAVGSSGAPRCQQVTLPDGDYEFSGCVTEEDNGTLDVTKQQSDVDGVDVSATASDQVSYEDGGSGGNALVSAKASTLSLSLSGTLIKIFRGVLDDQLTDPITVSVPHDTQIAGFTVSGTLTLTPDSGGQATGSVTVTLPAALGGEQGRMTFTTSVNEGLSDIAVSVPSATFMQLFSLSDVTLDYDPGTGAWSVSATATTGGTTSTPFSGSLTYSGNTLTAASLSVGAISLGGLANISQLTVGYDDGTWSGNVTFVQSSGGTATAAIALGFTGNTLTSGSITASNVALFGALDVATFAMSYASGTWGLSVTTTGGGGGSAKLTISGGIITAASLTLTDVSFNDKFTVADATVSYASSTPNPACDTVTGSEIWCGSWQVELPQATTVTGVSGAVAFAGGSFASGSIEVSGDVPLIDGVFLTSLGATLTISPPPTTISGTASIAFGPTVDGTTLLSATGTLTRTLPSTDSSGSYVAKGTLSSLSQALGAATVTVPGDGHKTIIDLSLGSSPSTGLTFSKLGVTVQVTGDLTGSFSSTTFSVTGSTQVTVNGTALASGSMKMDGTGMAACATTSSGKAGFEYVWSTGDLSVFGTKGCSERGF
jgi:YVTN family beta-propeller protein